MKLDNFLDETFLQRVRNFVISCILATNINTEEKQLQTLIAVKTGLKEKFLEFIQKPTTYFKSMNEFDDFYKILEITA